MRIKRNSLRPTQRRKWNSHSCHTRRRTLLMHSHKITTHLRKLSHAALRNVSGCSLFHLHYWNNWKHSFIIFCILSDPVVIFKWVLPAVLTTVSRRKSRAPPVQGIILQHFTDFRQNSVYTNTPTEACVRDAETRQKEIKPAPQYSNYVFKKT